MACEFNERHCLGKLPLESARNYVNGFRFMPLSTPTPARLQKYRLSLEEDVWSGLQPSPVSALRA